MEYKKAADNRHNPGKLGYTGHTGCKYKTGQHGKQAEQHKLVSRCTQKVNYQEATKQVNSGREHKSK